MLFNRSKDSVFYQTLVEAAGNIVEAMQLFRQNVETLEHKEEYAEKLKDLENKGDEFTHLLVRELNQTFVTPMDREDILQLALKLDDVLDGVEACASRFVYCHVDKTTPYLMQFAEILEKSAEFLQEAFISLEKRDFNSIQKYVVEINLLENQADRLMRESVGSLFENPVDPIELIKMKEVYERLEDVTDTAEDLADVLESVVMKYA
ncbi:DUF47 domain-containing protein [Kroppenstedtia eburnea]|uniref:TIGR00153 family protein n=1 Tax=Kroppenstedtia eburnea TaxID=714067 RepID=A0A1N7Q5X3_9BACL|nr:DUF47 family protein [Kroppenstedtia eburnea]EGK11406.1 phosphate transport regulator [Desmospora sp. 8437]QKI83184.1 DUF47 domain-containing protein [Kroppenstedtia eburnea]SIT18254.1 hypothetical protein SAMN05421790_1196 [Kroppenstedtia eburnea]